MSIRSTFTVGVIAASALAACSSGGGNVTGNNPLNPTPAPTGVVATATPTAVGATATPTAGATATPTTGATATPTAGATATPTAGATATPTAGATATPTAAATATPTVAPTPTPTATGSTASCTTSTAAASSMTYTLTAAAETITLPTYNVFTGTSMVPTTSPAGTVLTVKDSQNNFDNVAASTSSDSGYAARAKDFYASLTLSQSTSFGNGSNTQKIPITLNSPCITNGTTYHVDLFALGSLQYQETDVAVGNSVTGNIEVTVNAFPGGVTADVVLSH